MSPTCQTVMVIWPITLYFGIQSERDELFARGIAKLSDGQCDSRVRTCDFCVPTELFAREPGHTL